jgi:hypothetical protein
MHRYGARSNIAKTRQGSVYTPVKRVPTTLGKFGKREIHEMTVRAAVQGCAQKAVIRF